MKSHWSLSVLNSLGNVSTRNARPGAGDVKSRQARTGFECQMRQFPAITETRFGNCHEHMLKANLPKIKRWDPDSNVKFIISLHACLCFVLLNLRAPPDDEMEKFLIIGWPNSPADLNALSSIRLTS
jgi:hypothetical protein